MRKVGFVGTKFTTIDCMRTLLEDDVSIETLITISPEHAQANRVAGYADAGAFAKQAGVPVYYAERYDLKGLGDAEAIAALELDILLVIGWERLIPAPVLDSLGLFACGMHGSHAGLPRGRGRSPLNWSLILGHDRFTTSLFMYDSGVDAGNVIASQDFEITPFDTIETLHLKNRIAMNKLLREHLPAMMSGVACGTPQEETGSTYYPKRTPEDGAIDWRLPTSQIRNQVRALASPYPGAFTLLGNQKLAIWEAIPFDPQLFDGGLPGQILERSSRGSLVVRTGDGALLVTNHEGIELSDLPRGTVFCSVDFARQIEGIATRYGASVTEEQKEISGEVFRRLGLI